MTYFDVFHGDADGLCALQQLRLAQARDAVLVTGAKRESALLRAVEPQPGDSVTVLDIPLEQNRESLLRVLKAGAAVAYYDHHYAGVVPEHANLEACIDTAPDVCASLLVDRHLKGRHRLWAIVGSFGDNMHARAFALSAACGLISKDIGLLRSLGELLNYNAYGDSVSDLLFHPAKLAEQMRPYRDPRDFIQDSESYRELAAGYDADMAAAGRLMPEFESKNALVLVLPDEQWSRRVRGSVANSWASTARTRALAVLSPNARGGYVVSLRAPLSNPVGADELCRQFNGGGGRAAAAGINHLDKADLDRFIAQMDEHFAEKVS